MCYGFFIQVPDIIDNAYVIVEFENGARGMLDLCMFAEGSKNEQEISVIGEVGKVWELTLQISYLPKYICLESNLFNSFITAKFKSNLKSKS